MAGLLFGLSPFGPNKQSSSDLAKHMFSLLSSAAQ